MPKYKYTKADSNAPWEVIVLNTRVKNGQSVKTDGYLNKAYVEGFNALQLESHEPYTNTILFSTTGTKVELDTDETIIFDIFAQVSTGSLTITINGDTSKKITVYNSGLIARYLSTVAVKTIEMTGSGCVYGVVNNTFTPMDAVVVKD